jgi:hypothetical protein
MSLPRSARLSTALLNMTPPTRSNTTSAPLLAVAARTSASRSSGEPRLAEHDLAQRGIHPGHFAQQHAQVRLGTEHCAQRCCDVRRRRPSRRHLVEPSIQMCRVI